MNLPFKFIGTSKEFSIFPLLAEQFKLLMNKTSCTWPSLFKCTYEKEDIMMLIQVVIREDDSETLMCFYTEIKLIVITYIMNLFSVLRHL